MSAEGHGGQPGDAAAFAASVRERGDQTTGSGEKHQRGQPLRPQPSSEACHEFHVAEAESFESAYVEVDGPQSEEGTGSGGCAQQRGGKSGRGNRKSGECPGHEQRGGQEIGKNSVTQIDRRKGNKDPAKETTSRHLCVVPGGDEREDGGDGGGKLEQRQSYGDCRPATAALPALSEPGEERHKVAETEVKAAGAAAGRGAYDILAPRQSVVNRAEKRSDGWRQETNQKFYRHYQQIEGASYIRAVPTRQCRTSAPARRKYGPTGSLPCWRDRANRILQAKTYPGPGGRSRSERGFSLIELMVVIVIVTILALAIVPRVMNRPDQARVARARQDIQVLESALRLYRLDNLTYPTTAQGLRALVEQPTVAPVPANWASDGYINRLPKDPWGRHYLYLAPGVHGEIDIFSYGADGEPDGAGADADISNWME